MYRNVKIIYNREMMVLSKKRVFVFVFSVVSVVLSLFVLICINRILVRASVEGTMNYEALAYLHRRIWDIIYFLCIIFSIFLASTSINLDKKRQTLDNILATNVNKVEIVFGKYISYVVSVMALSIVCMPICMISTFFGGISYTRMIFLLILLFIILLFFISFTLMLSSLIYQENISSFVAIFFGAILMVLIFYFRDIVMDNKYIYIIVLLSSLVMSCIFIFATIKSRIFK